MERNMGWTVATMIVVSITVYSVSPAAFAQEASPTRKVSAEDYLDSRYDKQFFAELEKIYGPRLKFDNYDPEAYFEWKEARDRRHRRQQTLWRRQAIERTPILREFHESDVYVLYKDGYTHLLNYHAVKRFKDDDLKKLEQLKRLHTLSLEYTKVTGAGLRHLAAVPSLRHLWFFSCKCITDDDLEYLQTLPNLEHVSLDDTNIGDEGIRNLAKISQLQQLSLHATNVSDECILDIVQLRNLKTLSLGYTDITNDGLQQLKSLPKLQWLSLSGTKVTPDGVSEFQKARPSVTIAR